MGYGDNGGFRPRNNFSGGGNRGGGFGAPREMHDATCTECGQQTKVPFKPLEGKPVFCRDCYMKRKNAQA